MLAVPITTKFRATVRIDENGRATVTEIRQLVDRRPLMAGSSSAEGRPPPDDSVPLVLIREGLSASLEASTWQPALLAGEAVRATVNMTFIRSRPSTAKGRHASGPRVPWSVYSIKW